MENVTASYLYGSEGQTRSTITAIQDLRVPLLKLHTADFPSRLLLKFEIRNWCIAYLITNYLPSWAHHPPFQQYYSSESYCINFLIVMCHSLLLLCAFVRVSLSFLLSILS